MFALFCASSALVVAKVAALTATCFDSFKLAINWSGVTSSPSLTFTALESVRFNI